MPLAEMTPKRTVFSIIGFPHFQFKIYIVLVIILCQGSSLLSAEVDNKSSRVQPTLLRGQPAAMDQPDDGRARRQISQETQQAIDPAGEVQTAAGHHS